MKQYLERYGADVSRLPDIDPKLTGQIARLAIQLCVPWSLRKAEMIAKNEYSKGLLKLADQCERNPSRESALEASRQAYEAGGIYACHCASNAAYAHSWVMYAAASAVYSAAGDPKRLQLFVDGVREISH